MGYIEGVTEGLADTVDGIIVGAKVGEVVDGKVVGRVNLVGDVLGAGVPNPSVAHVRGQI